MGRSMSSLCAPAHCRQRLLSADTFWYLRGWGNAAGTRSISKRGDNDNTLTDDANRPGDGIKIHTDDTDHRVYDTCHRTKHANRPGDDACSYAGNADRSGDDTRNYAKLHCHRSRGASGAFCWSQHYRVCPMCEWRANA